MSVRFSPTTDRLKENEQWQRKAHTSVKLRSTESSHMYLSYKNRRNDTQRLELKKYDPTLRRHVIYRETK